MNAEQLLRELCDTLNRRCKLCVDGVPMMENTLAFYHTHKGGYRCELRKTEYDLVKKAEAFLMDG